MEEKYKDFTRNPEEFLDQGQTGDLVKITGISRSCKLLEVREKDYFIVEGVLELGKGKFVRIYGTKKRTYTLADVEINKMVSDLRTSSESNQKIRIKGLYNEMKNEILMRSVKLGNLEERFFDAEKIFLKIAR